MTSSPCLYTRTLDGHRGAYLKFLRAQIGGDRGSICEILTTQRPVMFLMIEDNFFLYVCTALLRTILRRRTVGLLFRPGPTVSGTSLRLKIKSFALKAMRPLKSVQTLSIVPLDFLPEQASLIDDWIHDFQLWDIGETERAEVSAVQAGLALGEAAALAAAMKQTSTSRPILAALGVQSRGKGFSILTEAARQQATAGWAVCVTGRVSEDQKTAKARLGATGALIEDRFASDAEIWAIYACASAIWCLYDPSYDQASGILGRAVQFGVPVVVRDGSISHALCQAEDLPHCAASGPEDLAQALASLPRADPARGAALSEKLRNQNITKLLRALGHGDVV